MLKQSSLTQNIAWNGICLKIPKTWEIDSLDTDYLLIGEDGSPMTEIKWTEAPKQFTLEKYLKQFIRRSQKLLNIKIHELPTPGSFSYPGHDFEFFFFSWESNASIGNGALIFCSLCKRLTLIRFFPESGRSSKTLPDLILASFTDHPITDQTHWQMFGFNFLIPRSFHLLEYSFKPGSFILKFEHKKTLLTFFSWGPALFLLSKTSLPEFAVTRLPQLKGFATAGSCIRGNYLEWSFRCERFKNAGILPFLKQYALFSLFRICHDTQNNRIFGILVDSPVKFEHDLIKWSMIGDG